MSSMFPPVEDDATIQGGGFDFASALGIQLPDGITAEAFQEFLWQAHIANTGRVKLQHINTIEQVIELIEKSSNILVLTGAGISCSAGIPDFRSENGLYSTLKDRFNLDDPTTMFDMNYFLKDPSLFYSFGGDICPGFDDSKIKYYPTPTHYFIKLLELKGKLLRNYTQNIDTLEYRAGINNIITCHGSYLKASCINCQFQMHGIDIQKHIFDEIIPYCPYCRPDQSDLKYLIQTKTDNKLRKHKPIITSNQKGNILQIRLPKILCTNSYLQNGCPILFSFDENILQKAMYEDDEINTDKKDENDEINMNFRTLLLKSDNKQVLNICSTAIMQWLQTDIKSFGVIKPEIVFFSEALSTNYHETLEEDIKKCDLLLVLGTSLLVAPVNTIPKKVSSKIPAILINREVVGYPNEFDVNLLGNCDDVVITLIHKLKWDFIQPIRKHINDNNENKIENDIAIKESVEPKIKPIKTMKCDTEIIKYEFVDSHYYIFPNGKLPEDVYRTPTHKKSDVDIVVEDIIKEEKEKEKEKQNNNNDNNNNNDDDGHYAGF